MSSPTSDGRKCEVIGADKLAAEAGGADAICQAISESMARRAPGIDYQVKVNVRGPSMLAATIILPSGKVLPEQKFAVMDRTLTRSMISDFSDSIAEAVVSAPGA